jgi:hypothetical protein
MNSLSIETYLLWAILVLLVYHVFFSPRYSKANEHVPSGLLFKKPLNLSESSSSNSEKMSELQEIKQEIGLIKIGLEALLDYLAIPRAAHQYQVWEKEHGLPQGTHTTVRDLLAKGEDDNARLYLKKWVTRSKIERCLGEIRKN